MDKLRALQKQARWGDPELSSLRDADALSAQHTIESHARHLLPIAEALGVGQCWSWGDDDCAEHSPDDLCGRCKALKALQEALDG